jgi:hypothetical protein
MSYSPEEDIELLRSKEHILTRNITLISDFPDDCWLWHGSVDMSYGRIFLFRDENGKSTRIKSHRFSYLLYVGPIPKGLHCLHTCDEPRCCNPLHLFLGTHKDNMYDMIDKRRSSSVGVPGKVISEETRKKISESLKQWYKDILK